MKYIKLTRIPFDSMKLFKLPMKLLKLTMKWLVLTMNWLELTMKLLKRTLMKVFKLTESHGCYSVAGNKSGKFPTFL